jgi:hypothetical protein
MIIQLQGISFVINRSLLGADDKNRGILCDD